jgi:large subunit ribosomal protein L10
MALSREKKQETVEAVKDLLARSKMTVFATYSGTPVSAMQELRAQASEDGTTIKIIKNRLFKQALAASDNFKNVETDSLKGQLLYAFNASDEAAPAQSLAVFARSNPQIEFVGAMMADGQILMAQDVKVLASLPSKNQLRAQLIATISSPLSSVANAMSENVRGVMRVLNARADSLSS